MSGLITISARHLGEVALPNFCPRCFWIKLRLSHKTPFFSFPGIFSSIDSYTKRVVDEWFARQGGPPRYLGVLGPLKGRREPPHYSRFRLEDDEHGIVLRGTPDAVFVRADDTYLIADYKTARHTGNQDGLAPLYEAQLNAYAMIGERCGLSPVSGLALIYFEPQTDEDAARRPDVHRDDGFLMGFSADVVPVTLDAAMLRPLFARTREIHDLPRCPPGREGCRDCVQVNALIGVVAPQ